MYKTFDLDFIKTMNNGMYAVENYGEETTIQFIQKVIKETEAFIK